MDVCKKRLDNKWPVAACQKCGSATFGGFSLATLYYGCECGLLLGKEGKYQWKAPIGEIYWQDGFTLAA